MTKVERHGCLIPITLSDEAREAVEDWDHWYLTIDGDTRISLTITPIVVDGNQVICHLPNRWL